MSLNWLTDDTLSKPWMKLKIGSIATPDLEIGGGGNSHLVLNRDNKVLDSVNIIFQSNSVDGFRIGSDINSGDLKIFNSTTGETSLEIKETTDAVIVKSNFCTGKKTQMKVKNMSGVTIPINKIVRLSGYDATDNLMTVEIQAVESEGSTTGENVVGVTNMEILNGNIGCINIGGVFDVVISAVESASFPNFPTGTDIPIGSYVNSPNTNPAAGTATDGEGMITTPSGNPGTAFRTLESIGDGAGILPKTVKCIFGKTEIF